MALKVSRRNAYERLRSVVLTYPVGDIYSRITDPVSVWFTSIPNVHRVQEQIVGYARLLESLGVEVIMFPHDQYPNMLFLADLAQVIDNVIVYAAPKHAVRQGEQYLLKRELQSIGPDCDYIGIKNDEFSLEATDIILTDDTAICSVGGRTSYELVRALVRIGVFNGRLIHVVRSLSEGIPQHLLGHKHVLGPDTLMSRVVLNRETYGFGNIIPVGESDEVIDGFAANVVYLGGNCLVMPAGCPNMRRILELRGFDCFETPMDEVHKMCGSLACVTLELVRED